VVFVALLRSAWALLTGFFVNFLGDVQIYCTHDENARFYQMRKQIVNTVESVILQVLRATVGVVETRRVVPAEFFVEPEASVDPLYDRVYIAGHSLGSTISVDALLNIHDLYREKGLGASAWRRIRALITFGTAVEKTKFFFDVRKPTVSFSPDYWRDDVYGDLFSDDVGVLDRDDNSHGIYWANYWYFTDIVANEVDSYRRPGGPHDAPVSGAPVCANARLGSAFAPWHPWVHSDYLGDDRFWQSGNDKYKRRYVGVREVLQNGWPPSAQERARGRETA
jgi:hypothetical protein